jgi:hypothetical protein
MDLRAKWETIAAKHPDQKARERARAVLSELGGEPQSGPYAEGYQSPVPEPLQRPAVDPLDAAMQRRQQAQPEPDGDGVLDMAGKALNYAGSEMLTGLRGLGGGLIHPSIARTPRERDMAERVVNLGTRAADAFSLGAYSGVTDMAGLTDPESRAALAEKHKGGSMYGDAMGALGGAVAGPAKLITEGVTRGMTRLAPGLMTQMQGRIGAPMIAGGLVGGTQGAVGSGGDLEATFEGAGAGAAAGAASATIPLGVDMARRGIQKASPWVGRYAQAKDAGKLPAAEALPKGQEGVTRASEQARDKILTQRDAKMAKAGTEYQAVEDAAASAPADVSKVREALDKVRQGNQLSTGQPISRALDDEIAALEAQVLDDVPTSDLLALRRSLQERANFQNKSPSDREMAARKLYEALRQGVRSSSPALGEADDMFSAASKEARKTDELLGSNKPVKSVKQRRAAAAELEYLGSDSVPAQRRAPDLEALASQDPVFAQALDDLMAKKALEATRLTLTPGVRTGFTPAVSHIGGMPLQVAAQLGRAGGRLADQSLRNIQPVANLAPPLSLGLLDAYKRRREQQEP